MASVVSLLLWSVIPAPAQDIVIHAVNGKNGQPLANSRLVLWAFDTMSERMMPSGQQLDLHTDSNGMAIILAGAIKKSYVQIWVDFHHQCVDRPNLVSFAVNKILLSGVTAENNCSKRIVAEPAPHTLTIYARSPTFRERMAW